MALTKTKPGLIFISFSILSGQFQTLHKSICKCKQFGGNCSQLIISLTIWYKALISSHLFLRTLSITDSRVTPTVLTMESTVVSLTSQPARGSLIFRIWSMMSLVSGLEFLVVQGWLTTVSMLNLRSGSITNKPCNNK